MRSLLAKLLQREKYFIEEIDRLLFAPEKISLFPQHLKSASDASWIYMQGDADSADWNLARCLKEPEIAQKYFNLLPTNETQLLVEKKFEHEFDKYSKKGEIYWFESTPNIETALSKRKKNLSKQNWFKNSELRVRSNTVTTEICKKLNLEMFLFNNDSLLGFIKTIRETPDFAEVYIEVRPDVQEKGLGTYLLLEMINLVQNNDKILVYSVESDNLASIRIAQKADLSKFNVLTRFAI